MLSNDNIPKGFKILSESPILVIQYRDKLFYNSINLFFNVLIALLLISLFILVCWLLRESLSTLPHRILQPDFWEINQKELFQDSGVSLPDLFLLISFTYLISTTIYGVVWTILGKTEFRAFPEKLIVSHQLFGISRTHLIPSKSLLYFKQYPLRSDSGICGWGLKAITNQRRIFLFRSKIVLVYEKPIKHSDWLGKVLADFYKVEFLPSPERSIF